MQTIAVNKTITRNLADIRENLMYIRTVLENLEDRAKEDRLLSLAHVQDDLRQFQAINTRLNHWSGALALVVFLATAGAGLAALAF